MTIQAAIERYLKQIKRSKSPNTAAAYGQGLKAFAACLAESEPPVEVEKAEVAQLSPLWLEPFLNELQKQAVSTEHLYTTAVAGFYRYVAAQEWAELNLSTLEFELSQRRSQGKRLHIFPEKSIEKLLAHLEEEIPPPRDAGAVSLLPGYSPLIYPGRHRLASLRGL